MFKIKLGTSAKLTVLNNKKEAVLVALDAVHEEVVSINKSLEKVINAEEFTIRDSQEKIIRAKIQLEENQKLIEVLTPIIDSAEEDN